MREIEKAIGHKLEPKFYSSAEGRMLMPLMSFMPYCMNRVHGTERTWHFRSREYGALGCVFAGKGEPRYFNTVCEITPEIAWEIAHPKHSLNPVRAYSDDKVGVIYLHGGSFDPSEDRREWNNYLKRLRALTQLIESST